MRKRLAVLVVGELIGDAVIVGEAQEGLLPGLSEANSALSLQDSGLSRGGDGWRSSDTLGLLVRPGGSPANVAVGLARLGTAVGFAGRLSSSGLGPWLNSHLTRNGVDVSFSVWAREAPTLAMLTLDAAGMATYSFYGADTADWYWRREELPRPEKLSVAAVHTGSLATVVSPGAEALASWIADLRGTRDVVISYDPNVRPSRIADAAAFTVHARSLVKQAHLVKVSEGDLAFMYSHADPVMVARSWAEDGPELVVLTRGPREALAFRPDGSCVVGEMPAGAVVDTVGAGDAFSAGLLAWLAEAGALHPGGLAALGPAELVRMLHVAGRVAGVACTRPGASLPHRSEVVDAPWP
jgi:fructokinase